jgi:hypothetical protein
MINKINKERRRSMNFTLNAEQSLEDENITTFIA